MAEHNLPPLNALRAFEAAARHGSVKHAAAELYVTPGAVSQMIRSLEAHFGVPLFRRVNRGVLLTDAGRGLLPPVRNAFHQIGEAARRVASSSDTGVLTVSATPFFASAWLVPRLGAFQAAHPDIDLHIVTGTALTDFSCSSVDVAVRHGLGRYPGLRSNHVLAVGVVPVAAPALVARLGAPSSAAGLLRWPRVHDQCLTCRIWTTAASEQEHVLLSLFPTHPHCHCPERARTGLVVTSVPKVPI